MLSARSPLARLARKAGLQTTYIDGLGQRRVAPAEAVLAVLQGLGIGINGEREAADALASLQQERQAQLIEPVVVAWGGQTAPVPVRLPARCRTVWCRLAFEGGGEQDWTARAGKAITLPDRMPIGVHRLTIDTGSVQETATVLAAPRRCDQAQAGRSLGIFLPLYALRSERNWGVGDLTDLRALGRWASKIGCGFVGTLPLLSTYLGHPFDPSPYAPVSRLFWNELYLDPTASPDFAASPAARRLAGSARFAATAAGLRDDPLVDYAGVYDLKRRVLDQMATAAFESRARREQIRRFADSTPLVREYAAFRAAAERAQRGWRTWPDRMRRGILRPADFDERRSRTYLYSQFLLHEQLSALRASGPGLYLDLPIGVHADGFDTWRFRESFADGLSVGAPPDALFTGGQNWGFPPPHPRRSRLDGHAYFRASLRSLLSHASALRIDHIMGLHRLFCIPHGQTGEHGIYVTQPARELYAALCIESHRARAEIVGENLGTVPPQINTELDRRGILKMSVAIFEMPARPSPTVPPPPAQTLASLNTHDTPTFAAFWTGKDISLRRRLGLLTAPAAAKERRDRARLRSAVTRDLARRGLLVPRAGTAAAARAVLAVLAASPARKVLVNLEDLWGETHPQNVPGTSEGVPNWRRKAARDLEAITTSPTIRRDMNELASLRRRVAAPGSGENHPRTSAARRPSRPPASRGGGRSTR